MGQLKPNAVKNTSFWGLYKCCELKYWQNNDQKWNTICRLKTVYDDYIIKWPLKHRIVLSIEKLRQKLSLEWYSSRAVLIGWVKNSLDAFVAPCYSRNRVFWGIWWLIQCIYCNIKVPIVKYCSTENWTVREGGFRSCHRLRSFSSMRRVWWGWIVAQNQRHIFLLLFWQSAVRWPGSCIMCIGGTLLSFSFCILRFRALWLVSRRSKPAFPAIAFINEVKFIDSYWTRLEPAFTEVFAVIYAEVIRCFDALHWARSFLRVEFVDKNWVFFGWSVPPSESFRFYRSNVPRLFTASCFGLTLTIF